MDADEKLAFGFTLFTLFCTLSAFGFFGLICWAIYRFVIHFT